MTVTLSKATLVYGAEQGEHLTVTVMAASGARRTR
jgi:hypothetical protein